MPLYIVGLGLGDEKDITVKGREAIERCTLVFLESYTSVLGVSKERLEEAYGKPVQIAYRETVESEAHTILEPAKRDHVAFLVVGDPFGATTHTDLLIRAQDEGIETHVVHNASIMNAAGACGLQLYNFGATISLPFFRDGWRPDSWYDKAAYNAAGGMHTLCLLDIKVREPDFDHMVQTGRTRYEAPRFMTVAQAVAQLLEVEATRGGGVCTPDAMAVGLARVGQATQQIVAGTLAELAAVDFGPPLHSLVLAAPQSKLHELEAVMLQRLRRGPTVLASTAPEAEAAATAETCPSTI